MKNNSLTRLEFDLVKQKLQTYCKTIKAKDKVDFLTPLSNKEDVQLALTYTSLALNLIQRKGSIPIEGFSDIEIHLKNLESNNPLSSRALLDIATVLKISRQLKEYFYQDESFDLSDFDSIKYLFDNLYSNANIETKIFSAIIDEDTIADDASKQLSALRRNRRSLEQGVKTKLTNFIHSSTYAKYIMDPIVTIRNDRYVIPVKEEYRSKISGSILDISASGSTVYIEPSSIYEINNKINSIKAEEVLEIEKILKKLSIMLFPITENLRLASESIYTLDFIFAKAAYSKSINGISPILNDTKNINLIQARHPLISEDTVVPIDISIGKDYTSLLITGPNTGGKTVSLKIVGLLTVMACSGLHIPANEHSSIYVFDNIFADIGDEQSIQESLSTFSSHMLNIVNILKLATENSLILLDELCSGTDPIEGASLAISLLEFFHKLGALTIATTHYPELKNYALVTSGFENASSDFDIENLKPTYKLLMGVPGKSNAFAISKQLGVPAEIIMSASTYLKEDNVSIENLLKNIYEDKLEIEKEKENIKKNSNQIELLKRSLERDNSKLNSEAESIISNAKIKAREILLDAKDEANEIIKELNEKNISSKEANKLRNDLNNSLRNINSLNHFTSINNSSISNLNKDAVLENKEALARSINIGQTVILKKFNQTATVMSLPNKSNEIQVQIGVINMNAKLDDILVLSSNSSQNLKNNIKNNVNINSPSEKSNNSDSSHKTTKFSNILKSQTVSPEINIIGLNVDEATSIVDKYLDDAYLAGLKNVRIVHGKGTGKLREGIHSFLKKHPHVTGFRLGTFGEGEMGVTVVELK